MVYVRAKMGTKMGTNLCPFNRKRLNRGLGVFLASIFRQHNKCSNSLNRNS